MDRQDRIMNLLNYLACLSEPEPGVPATQERLNEINKCIRELAHEIQKP